MIASGLGEGHAPSEGHSAPGDGYGSEPEALIRTTRRSRRRGTCCNSAPSCTAKKAACSAPDDEIVAASSSGSSPPSRPRPSLFVELTMRAVCLLATSRRLLPRAASLAAAAASASVPAAILCEPAPPPKSAAPARLRRQSTLGSYVAGQAIEVLYVPQVVGPGVDVGHVVLVVENLDGTHGTLGFYPSSLTLGLRSVAGEEAVVVTPDPLYAKALTSRDGRLAAKVQPLYRGVLSAEQAAKLNAWSDALVLTTRTFWSQ